MPHSLSPVGNCDVLDIVVHQIIRMSDVIVSDILDLDHLPIIFHILDYIKIRTLSEPIEKFTDWDLFQSLALEISPTYKINLGVKADRVVRDFTASVASAYSLATSKVKILDITMIFLV
jgi:hypothetical protein